MHNKVRLITLIFVLSLIGLCSAAYITLQADGFPFTTNENILFHGDLNGNNIDVNFWVVNASGTTVYQSYLGDRNGSFSVTYAPSSEGDYNAYARDLDNNIQAVLPFKVSDIASVTVNYDTTSPPFDASSVGRVYVTFTAYDVNGNTLSNKDINVELVRAIDANVLDENRAKTGADGNIQLSFDLSGLLAGDYYFSVNDGLAVFPFSVYLFRVYPYLLDKDTNNPQSTFAPDSNAYLVVDVKNYADTNYISGATVIAKIYDSDNNLLSTHTLSGSGSYSKLIALPHNTGNYRIDVNVMYSGTTQIVKLDFAVQQYKMEVFGAELGGGREKEKMPAVFPTASEARLELHFVQLGSSPLAGTTLQNICNNGVKTDHNFLLYYKRAGETNWEQILNKQDINVEARSSYCELTFITPGTASPYFVMVKGVDLNIDGTVVTLTAKTMITVQDYMVFLEPVDPNTCDTTASDVASSCGFKFSFSQGESIGLRPDIIDLKQQGGILEIGSVSGAHVFHSGSETILTSPADVNYRKDLNIIVLNPNGPNISNLSGGFYIGGFTVDVNKDGNTVQQNVTAFGFFSLRVLSVSTELVDENGNTLQTRGPPIYSSDANINIKVTVKSSDGTTAIQGAVVSVTRLTNFETRQFFPVDNIDSNTTNSSGVTIIKIDKNALGLTSGEYEVVLDINAPTVNKTDSVMMHFERRNFFVEAYPASKTNCAPEPFIATDQNITIFVEAKNPFNWDEYDPNSFTLPNVRVYYEGSPDKPLATPILVQNGNGYPSICTCGDRNYKCLDVVPINPPWKTGFYRVTFTVDRNGVMENGIAFVKVLPFYLSVGPAYPNTPFEEYAAPGSQWDFNIYSSQDVNITAKLISARDWRVFARDLNMHYKSTGVCLAGTGNGCDNNFTDLNANTLYTIDVNIPSSLPLAREDFDGYILQIDANSASSSASVELFIIPKKWQLYLGKETTAMMMQSDGGEPGPYYFSITESGRQALLIDNNVEDNCEALDYPTYDDNGLTYSRIIMPRNSQGPTDFTRIVLLDPDNNVAYVDYDNDCDFSEIPDNVPVVVGQVVTGLDMNKVAHDWSVEPPEEIPHPRNGPVIFTTIGKSKVSYITTKLAEDLNYSSAGGEQDPFYGSVEINRPIGIPVVIRNLDDTPAAGITVSISSVMKVELTGGMPEQLQPTVDYNVYDAITDANGIAIPKIKTNKSGILLLGFTITDGSASQAILPWEGAALQVVPFSVTVSYALQDLNIQFNINVCDPNSDYNIDVNLPITCFNPCDTNIAVLDETNFNGLRINFDNDGYYDQNNLFHPIVVERWYFIPLTGAASCPDATFASYPGQKATLIIDDDNYINPTVPDGGDEYGLKGGPQAVTTVPASLQHLDLNEVLVGDASAFPICLYGFNRCSSNEQGNNPGAKYDINRDIDGSLTDGNLIIYNAFTQRGQFYDPETMGSSASVGKQIVFRIRNFDYNLVSGSATITGSLFDEQAGTQASTFSGSANNGLARIPIDGNFYVEPHRHGKGFMVSANVTYNNSTVPTFSFMWSTH